MLLLDLNLKGEDGFELLEHAVASSFHTIVISGNFDKALVAFEYGLIDFIPKPFDRERLRITLDRMKSKLEVRHHLKKNSIRNDDSILLLPPDFNRVHKSYLVSLQNIKEIKMRNENSPHAITVNEKEIPIARRSLKDLQRKILLEKVNN